MLNTKWSALASALSISAMLAVPVTAAPIQSYTPVITGTLLADFDGMTEGTLISNQYPGVTFSQGPLGGRPQIDNFPWIFGYGSLSGGVLTGSTEGGYPSATVASLIAMLDTPVTGIQVFLSDTSPLGSYRVASLDSTGTVVESFSVAAADILPPGYAGGFFPAPGTTPLPGLFVGFLSASADIYGIRIDASQYPGDAFAIDDLRVIRGNEVPEPGTWLLAGSALAALGLLRRKAA